MLRYEHAVVAARPGVSTPSCCTCWRPTRKLGIEAAVAATAFVRDVDETVFLASDLIQSAVLQKLLVIGNASKMRLIAVFGGS